MSFLEHEDMQDNSYSIKYDVYIDKYVARCLGRQSEFDTRCQAVSWVMETFNNTTKMMKNG